MATLIELTAVNWKNERAEGDVSPSLPDHGLRVINGGDEDEGLDDLEQPRQAEPAPTPEPASSEPAQVARLVPTETHPIVVNVDDIREFYPRRPDRMGRVRTGTNICYKSGTRRPVIDTFDEVKAKIAAANGVVRARSR